MAGEDDNSDDRDALRRAFAGVTPLKGKQRVEKRRAAQQQEPAPRRDSVEEEGVRSRLDDLVGGDYRFDVEYPDAYSVVGVRKGVHRSHVTALQDPTVGDDDALDLHGMRAEEAKRAVVKYVRSQRDRGFQYGLVIHGKGKRSTGGKGVLRGVAIEALTKGGAAPFVLAFATAPRRLGGEGALVIKLEG